MSDWPSSPLIRITSGNLRGVPLHGAIAASAGLAATGEYFKYQIIQGPGTGYFLRKDCPDSGRILSWEDVAPVPITALLDLLEAWRGLGGDNLRRLRNVEDALDPALSCLPRGNGTALTEVSDVDVSMGRLPDPYRLDVAYAGGQPIGTVEKIVMDEPNPDRLGPYPWRALREPFTVYLRELNFEGREVEKC